MALTGCGGESDTSPAPKNDLQTLPLARGAGAVVVRGGLPEIFPFIPFPAAQGWLLQARSSDLARPCQNASSVPAQAQSQASVRCTAGISQKSVAQQRFMSAKDPAHEVLNAFEPARLKGPLAAFYSTRGCTEHRRLRTEQPALCRRPSKGEG